MKVIQSITVLFLAFFVSIQTIAANTPLDVILEAEMTGEAYTQKALEVRLHNLEKERTVISIQDLDGQVFFKDIVNKKPAYANRFLLHKLPVQTYMLVVQNKKQTFCQAFDWNGNNVELFKSTEATEDIQIRKVSTTREGMLNTKFKASAQYLDLVVANLKFLPTTIQLVRPNEGVVYEAKTTTEAGFAKVINFKGLKKGNYYILIEHPDQTEIRMINFTKHGVEVLNGQILQKGANQPITG